MKPSSPRRALPLSASHAARLGLALSLGVAGCGSNDTAGPSTPTTGEDASLARPTLATRRLRTSGRWLTDALGRKVVLRGVNAGGRAKMPPFSPFDYAEGHFDEAADLFFTRVRALGTNAVRLTFSWEGLEPVEGQRDLAYWGRYRELIDAAHRHDVGVIVDFHQDVYAGPFCGDGFPLWTIGSLPHGESHYDCGHVDWSFPYFDPKSTVNQAFQRFWDDTDGVRTKLLATWRFIARDLAAHPGVLAFEIINEPGVGTGEAATLETTVLPAFFEQFGAAIHEEAGPGAVLGGTTAGQADVVHHLSPPKLDDWVFAPHYYDASAFLGLASLDRAKLAEGLVTSISLPGAPAVPVIVGEYGMPNSNKSKAEILDLMLDIFDEHRVNAFHWDAHVSPTLWNHENFTTFNVDGTERDWVPSIDRPFPRAIAGDDVTFTLDRATETFTMSVTGATAGVTEVYIPKRRFGAAPRVTVTGARWRWLPAEELLLLSAPVAAKYAVTVAR